MNNKDKSIHGKLSEPPECKHGSSHASKLEADTLDEQANTIYFFQMIQSDVL